MARSSYKIVLVTENPVDPAREDILWESSGAGTVTVQEVSLLRSMVASLLRSYFTFARLRAESQGR